MAKKIALLQSNYIPWKGYFDIINMADVFIFHDDLQYTHGDWRNRNKIKTRNGLEWISVPCGTSESRLICEVELKDKKWQKKHWAKIEQSYIKAKYFSTFKDYFMNIFLDKEWNNLSDMNQFIIKSISKDILKINTKFEDTRSYDLENSKAERVLELLEKTGAEVYLSGPAAKNYFNESMTDKIGVKLEWMDYSGYPEYNQLYPPFEHGVSILDLIFNEGENAKKFMKSFSNEN